MPYNENDSDLSSLVEVSTNVDEEHLSTAHVCYDPSEWYGEYLDAYYHDVKEHPGRCAAILSSADQLLRTLRRVSSRRN